MNIFIVICYIISVKINLGKTESESVGVAVPESEEIKPGSNDKEGASQSVAAVAMEPQPIEVAPAVPHEKPKQPIQRSSWTRPKSCDMKPMAGPCSNMVTMFYFVKASSSWERGSCKEFVYGGCMGNGNRFHTIEECEDYCITGESAKKKQPDRCKPSHAYGDCFGIIDRWAYDRVFKTCKMFMYSGCGGNPNNFRTRDKCEAECVLNPSREIALSNYYREGPERPSSNTTDTNTTNKGAERTSFQAKIEIQDDNGSVINIELNTNYGNTPEKISKSSSSDNANINNPLRENDNLNVNNTMKLNDAVNVNQSANKNTNIENIYLNKKPGKTTPSSSNNTNSNNPSLENNYLNKTDTIKLNDSLKVNDTTILNETVMIRNGTSQSDDSISMNSTTK